MLLYFSDFSLCFCCCYVGVLRPFDTFQVISGAVSSVNYPHDSCASLLGSLPVLSAHLSPVTDNCPSWIGGRERMAIDIISWPISTKECYRMCGSNTRPSAYQADEHPTELLPPAFHYIAQYYMVKFISIFHGCEVRREISVSNDAKQWSWETEISVRTDSHDRQFFFAYHHLFIYLSVKNSRHNADFVIACPSVALDRRDTIPGPRNRKMTCKHSIIRSTCAVVKSDRNRY